MEQVFVDTAAWIALLNTSDQLHHQAQRVMHELEREQAHLITTELVLIEVADSLAAASVRAKTVAFVDRLRQLPILHIIPAQQALLDAAWALYGQRADKDWGLTDCGSFVVMTQEKITRAFTSEPPPMTVFTWPWPSRWAASCGPPTGACPMLSTYYGCAVSIQDNTSLDVSRLIVLTAPAR